MSRPRLGFVGIHAGPHSWRPVSQNETVAGLFEADGFEVRKCSAVLNPALRTAHHLEELVRWRDVDVVVCAVFSGRSFLIADYTTSLCGVLGRKVVLFLHGGRLPEFGREHRDWVDRVFRRADLVLAPSEYLAATFREWGIDVRVVNNVLSIDRYVHRPRSRLRPRLLWMRTFHSHYNPQMALRVLARVRKVWPDATMTMAGADQGEEAATRAEAERLGVAGAVEFPGYVDLAAKLAAFDGHDVFLNTNVVDNTPVSVLEAAASGMVIVATAVGGLPAMVDHGRNALLVASDDDEEMARQVLRLLDDAAAAAELSAGARALAERSAWPAVREQWKTELARLVPSWRDVEFPSPR